MQKYIIVSVLFLFAVALIFFGSTHWLGRDQIIAPPENITFLANIDLDGDSTFSIKHVVKGHEAILAVHSDNIDFQKLIRKLSVNDLKNFKLEYLDLNSDGLISPEDPMFWNLLIVSYDAKAAKFIVRPLYGSAVWAILVRNETFRKEHRAVLTDSSHRLAKEIFKD